MEVRVRPDRRGVVAVRVHADDVDELVARVGGLPAEVRAPQPVPVDQNALDGLLHYLGKAGEAGLVVAEVHLVGVRLRAERERRVKLATRADGVAAGLREGVE